MIAIEYTVVCKRGGRGQQTEADLEGAPLMRMFSREGPTQVTGVITVSGPGADKLDLGERIKLTIEKVVEIPVGLRPYNPQVYHGFIITDENDGRWRFYLGSRQVGWADSLERCKGLIDAQGEQTA